MIIHTFKQKIEKVFSVIYNFTDERAMSTFKLGTENTYYEFKIDSIDTIIEALNKIKELQSNKIKIDTLTDLER